MNLNVAELVNEVVSMGARTLVTLTFAEPVNKVVNELVLRGGRTWVRTTMATQGCTLEMELQLLVTLEVENDEQESIT